MGENKIAKAIAETQMEVDVVRADTRKRRSWGYVTLKTLHDWAAEAWPDDHATRTEDDLVRALFGTRLDAPVRRGSQGGVEMLAVWRRLEPPTTEPRFDGDPVFDGTSGAPIVLVATEEPAAATKP